MTTSTPILTVLAACALGSMSLVYGACSSKTTGDGSTTSSASSSGTSGASSSGDGGSSGTSGASSGTSGTSSGTSGTSGTDSGDPVAACISTCESMHPNGVQLGKGIDNCWGLNCTAQCNGIGTGMTKPPTTGMCKNPVGTPAVACSQCTVDKCCGAWDACFDNPDCAALNKCSIACYSK